MSRRRVLLPLALVALTLGLAPQSSSIPTQASGSLQLGFTITQKWRMSDDYCGRGTPANSLCLQSVGEAEVAGLGHVTVTFDKLLPADPSCFILHNNVTLIEVAGKGTLELSRPGRRCGGGPPPRVDGPFEFSVARGSGTYGGASGTFVYKSSVGPVAFPCHCGKARDTWTGMLMVPGLDFDVISPVLTGAVSKTVRAPKGAKRVRVRFTVRANDAVDGAVPVVCAPRSGSYFELGRTRVTCSARDSSANARQARFLITVRPST